MQLIRCILIGHNNKSIVSKWKFRIYLDLQKIIILELREL